MWCMVSSSTCSRRPAQQGGAQQRPVRQVERTPRLLGTPGRAPRPRARLRQRREVDHRQPHRGRRARSPAPAGRAPTAKRVRSASCRRRLASSAGAERPTSSVTADVAAAPACCRRRSPARAGRGTRAAAGQRRAAASRRAPARPDERRRASRAPRCSPRRSPRARPATVGCSNRPRSGSSTPKACAHPRDQLGGEQRMPAEREEVVVRARPRSTPEHLGEQAASSSSTGVRGAFHAPSAAAASGSGPGSASAAAVHLAVGRQRQRLQEHQGRRHHVVRQLGRGADPAATAGETSAPASARHSRPGPGRPARSARTTTAASATPGMRGQRLPRSRPARCGSRAA